MFLPQTSNLYHPTTKLLYVVVVVSTDLNPESLGSYLQVLEILPKWQ